MKSLFERAVERALGMPIEQIRNEPLAHRTGKFPENEYYTTHEQAEKMLDKALRPLG